MEYLAKKVFLLSDIHLPRRIEKDSLRLQFEYKVN